MTKGDGTLKKRLISAALAAIMIFALTALTSCSGNDQAPDGMKLASLESNPYKLYVPESWTVDLQTAATSAHVSADDLTNISVAAWSLKNTDSTADDWWKENLSEIEAAFTAYEFISEDEKEIGRYTWSFKTYKGTLGTDVYQYTQFATVKGGEVYVISYCSLPDYYDTHYEEALSIVDNFVIK